MVIFSLLSSSAMPSPGPPTTTGADGYKSRYQTAAVRRRPRTGRSVPYDDDRTSPCAEGVALGRRDRRRRYGRRVRGRGGIRGGGATPGAGAHAVAVPSPTTVRQAAVLVALEGAAGLVAAVVYVVSGFGGANEPGLNKFGNAAWVAIIGGGGGVG